MAAPMSDPSENLLPSLPQGFRAVVVGSRGDIGAALCTRLVQQQNLAYLHEFSRSESGLDLFNESSIIRAANEIVAPIHLLICATGALNIDGVGPEKALRQLDPQVMLAQFRTNAVGPALVAKHFLPLLDRSNRSIALFLSARVGSIGDNRLGGWISYRSSKAALNQIVRTASIEVGRTHPLAVVAAIHPGTVRTRLSDPYSSSHPTVSPEEAASNIISTANELNSSGVFVAYDGSTIEW